MSSSSIVTTSVVLWCEAAVDLHAKHGAGGGAEGVPKSCSVQQAANYVLDGHAINHSSNTAINQCGAGWGGLQGGGSWAMRLGRGGTVGVKGGWGDNLYRVRTRPFAI